MFPTHPEALAAGQFNLGQALASFGSRPSQGHSQTARIMVCEGDAFIDGDLLLDWDAGWRDGTPLGSAALNDVVESPVIGLVVAGNLMVTGAIINRQPEGGPFLYVRGNVNALHLVGGGSEIKITGDVHLEEVLCAHGNDGILDILGSLTAPIVISDGHSFNVSQGIQCAWNQDSGERFANEADDRPDDERALSRSLRNLLSDQVQAWGHIFEEISLGGSVLRGSSRPPRQRSYAEWQAMVVKDTERLGDVPASLISPALCLQAVALNGTALRHVPEPLKTPVLCQVACRQTGQALAFVPEPLKTHALCMLAAQHGSKIQFFPERVMDEALACALVRHNTRAYASLPARWQTDAAVAAAICSGDIEGVELSQQTPHAALAALDDGFEACTKIPGYLFTQQVFDKAQALFGQHPQWPALVQKRRPQATLDSDSFKMLWACFLDEYLCIQALQAGDLLYRMPRHLLTARVSHAAFEMDSFNFIWIPQDHMTQAMCERAVQNGYGALLGAVPPRFVTPDLCMMAVTANAQALEYVPVQLRSLALYVHAVKQHSSAFEQVPEALRLPVLTQLIAEDPENAPFYYNQRAALALAKGHFAQAVADCDEVLRHRPQFAQAYFQRADARHELGQWRQAFQDVLAVLALDPDYPWANNLMGVLYECGGCATTAVDDVPDAIAAYGREIRGQPAALRPLLNRAELYLRCGTTDKAYGDIERAIYLDSDEPQAIYLRGYLAHKAGDTGAAQQAFATAAALNPAGNYTPYAAFVPSAKSFTTADPHTLGAPRTEAEWLAAIVERPALVRILLPERRSPALYALAVERDPSLVAHVPKAMMNPALYTVAVAQACISIDNVPPEGLSEATCIAAVTPDGMRLRSVPLAWRTVAVCIAACQASPNAIDHVPEALRNKVNKALGKGLAERALDESLRTGKGMAFWRSFYRVLRFFRRLSARRKRD